MKARIRYGAKSLDLTIPVKICRDYQISEGDVFSVEVDDSSGDIKIIYTRIFKQ